MCMVPIDQNSVNMYMKPRGTVEMRRYDAEYTRRYEGE
jgi:hypothetical protein